MADKEMIQEKIGEALGLEKVAQKAVDELHSRGLLQPEHMKKLTSMKEQASRAGKGDGGIGPRANRQRWI